MYKKQATKLISLMIKAYQGWQVGLGPKESMFNALPSALPWALA
jgi:hypothetical protein